MTYVTLTELRANMAKYLDKVEADRTELIVTRQNHEPVVVVALSEWEGMKETLFLLSNPANAERLLKSVEDANDGKLAEHDLVEP